MINPLVILFPVMFGCRRVTLENLQGELAVERLVAILREMNAVDMGESATAADEMSNMYFRIGKRWVIWVIEDYKPVVLIAPDDLGREIQNRLIGK